MISLQQNSDYIIGSQTDIMALTQKEQARILTISDSHGDWRGLMRIVKQFGPTCDALVITGDCWRDLAELLELANEDDAVRKAIPPVLGFVRGNGDPSYFAVSYDIGKNNSNARTLPKGSVLMPPSLVLTVNGQQILFVHGHMEGVDFGYNKLGLDAKIQGIHVAVHGHTHVPHFEQHGDFTFINPGSISRPRGGSPASFAILTVEKTFVDAAFLRIKDCMGDEGSFEIFTPL
ncbi:MAG: YfcE family phosphodiesterase [Treponema sp.]|nr:YfcE family phosphodiesterase [Treponema sp.]